MINPISNTGNISQVKSMGSVKAGETPVIQAEVKQAENPKDHLQISGEKTVAVQEKAEETPQGNEVTFTPLIDDKVMTADVMIEVAKAKKSVLFETYLLNGEDGKALSDLLIKKKDEGLDVRVMLDPSMQKIESWTKKEDPLYQLSNYLRENGVNCVNYPVKKMHGSLTPSEHAKLLIIDDDIAYIGGTNIDDTNNHDINVKMQGPVAQDLKQFFNESWKVSNSSDPNEVGYTSDPIINNPKIKVGSTSPARSTVKPMVLKNIKEAKESIRIEMFTLTDDDIEKELLAAKKRGVDVQVILCDNKEIFHLPTYHMPNISAANKFKAAGIPVKWYVNDQFTQMHSKLCVFDHSKVMLGSANFIHNAFRGIHEYYSDIEDKDLAGKMEAQFDKDWKDHSIDVDNPNFAQKILGGVVEGIDDLIF